MSGPPWPESRLWPAALALYAAPGVADACLSLQDRHGLDVNRLLLALWLAQEGAVLDAATAAHLERLAGPFQREVLAPMRRARRALKSQIEADGVAGGRLEQARALRARLQALEIDLERLELVVLEAASEALPRAHPPSVGLAACNLRALHAFGQEDRDLLRALLAAAFPDAEPGTLESALAELSAS